MPQARPKLALALLGWSELNFYEVETTANLLVYS